MKHSIMTTLTIILAAQLVQATELYCGANVEQQPGSQIYNKLLFWEKVSSPTHIVRFALADGSIINSENLTPELLEKISDGTQVFGISFSEDRPQLFIAKVKKISTQQISYTDVALANSLDSKNALLMANGATLLCKEM